jgi:two-component system, chemotaxis family, sensor kinase CheA
VDPIVAEFLVESEENLDRIEEELLHLEKDPTQRERITTIFRAIHTIKGTCGFLELKILESVTHAGENLLVVLRDRGIPLNPDIATQLLQLVDAIRAMLKSLAESGTDGETDYSALIEELNRAVAKAGGAPPDKAPAPAPAVHVLDTATVSAQAAVSTADAPRSAEPAQAPPSSKRRFPLKAPALDPSRVNINSFQTTVSNPVVRELDAPPASMSLDASYGIVASSKGARPVTRSAPPPSKRNPAGTSRRSSPPGKAEAAAAQQAAQQGRGGVTIRVDVNVLEEMMTLVGELVLARNQLLQLTQEQTRTPLLATCQRLDQITTELQGCAMKTRMQPIGTVWNKFPRVVRELAVQCRKRAIVDLEGSETELDKTVLEAISEPLTHILRNAVDHGLEYPSLRAALGKPLAGRIRLRAGHKGGHVVIEVSDDGGGIRVDKVKEKAVQRGILSEQDAAAMADSEVFNLLFAPGFSTAEQVTNISGRGVGMDVVKTKIERIGGSIEIKSRPDEGSTFCIRLPLTLAIVPAIVVATEKQHFAIPQQGVQELLRITSPDQVEYVENAPVLRLRGQLLPLVWLSAALNLKASSQRAEGYHVVVLQAAEGNVGLVVDEIVNSEEIVVKPLSPFVAQLDCYAGCTILGDGRIALILEVANVVARVRGEVPLGARTRGDAAPRAQARRAQRGLVVFSIGDDRYALPLAQVERLEKLRVDDLESCSGQAVLQYRGETIRVARFIDSMNDFAAVRDLADSQGMLHAIICRSAVKPTALVVTQVLDVVEHDEAALKNSEIVALGRVTTLCQVPAEFFPVPIDSVPGNDATYEKDVA